MKICNTGRYTSFVNGLPHTFTIKVFFIFTVNIFAEVITTRYAFKTVSPAATWIS